MILEEEIKNIIEADNEELQSIPSSGLKLVMDVNRNTTKKGIKIQFIIPQGTDESKKEEITQRLKIKLNKGLANIDLSVDTDLDVPYQNVIGFLIRLESFKLLIKNILSKNNGEKPNNESEV
jgi:hypothetical protein